MVSNSKAQTTVFILGAGYAGHAHQAAYLRLGIEPHLIHLTGVDQLSQIVPPPGAFIDICTPTSTHLAVLHWAVSHNPSRISLEKPCGTNADRLQQLSSAARAPISACYNYAFSAAFSFLLDEIADSAISRIATTLSKDRSTDEKNRRGLAQGEAASDPYLLEIPHAINLTQRLVGPVDWADADSASNPTRVEIGVGDHPLIQITSDLASTHRVRSLEVETMSGRRIRADLALVGAGPSQVTCTSSGVLFSTDADDSLGTYISWFLNDEVEDEGRNTEWQLSLDTASAIETLKSRTLPTAQS